VIGDGAGFDGLRMAGNGLVRRNRGKKKAPKKGLRVEWILQTPSQPVT